ncbi:amino acid ABC transporter permease [Falsiroseomonas oryzae]|uniref:amino acid ABC transporter permease n=1 Tax=Falsiroseomonas oryzae TaxID=2766473 RepID=UPI0022EB3B37|nr:amino acid ABC transporter permease [Roseomonas sp. MO-31]
MTAEAARPAPRGLRWRRLRGIAVDLGQFALFLGLIGWLLAEGAGRMGYNWQWYRVPRYLFQAFDGEIYPGPLLKGLLVTLEISAIALLLTVVIGLGAALLRLSGSLAGRWLVVGYVEAIRNTPLLVQLYIVYFILAPVLGMDRFWAGVLCLAAFEGAFATEIFRGGILAVRRGQWEAAWALGLSRGAAYRRVVLPQALRVILPPLAGLGVSLVKHSAIVSVIAVFDLTNEGRNIISDTFMTFEIWLTVAALYLCVTLLLSTGVGLLERRLKGAMA